MDLFERIIFSSITVILGFGSLWALGKCLRKTNHFGHLIQLLLTLLGISVVILFVHFAFGDTALHSVVTGLMIGFGLALQPLIKVVVNGLIFDGTRIAKSGRVIEVKGAKGTVTNVGMLHTWLEDSDGHLTMVSNNLFETELVKVYRPKSQF